MSFNPAYYVAMQIGSDIAPEGLDEDGRDLPPELIYRADGGWTFEFVYVDGREYAVTVTEKK